MFISNSGIDAASYDNVLVIVESSILEGNEEFTPSVTVTFQFSEVGVVLVCRRRVEELHSSSCILQHVPVRTYILIPQPQVT